jgi:hypothetical protein
MLHDKTNCEMVADTTLRTVLVDSGRYRPVLVKSLKNTGITGLASAAQNKVARYENVFQINHFDSMAYRQLPPKFKIKNSGQGVVKTTLRSRGRQTPTDDPSVRDRVAWAPAGGAGHFPRFPRPRRLGKFIRYRKLLQNFWGNYS